MNPASSCVNCRSQLLRMRFAWPIIALPLQLMISCSHPQDKTGSSDVAVEPLIVGGDTLESRNKMVETYTGILPCADCSGIETHLTLWHDEFVAEGKYELKQNYLGVSKGGQTRFVYLGEWTTLRGNNANPDATIVELMNVHDSSSVYFMREGANLLMLDQNQNVIKSKLNYLLLNEIEIGATKLNYEILENYFLKNTVSPKKNPSVYFVQSKAGLDSLLGIGKTMTNEIRNPDFNTEDLIILAAPATSVQTTIRVDSVKQRGTDLNIYFTMNTADELSYTITPLAAISVQKVGGIRNLNLVSTYEVVATARVN